LSDLGEDEWPHMLCAEASNILQNAVELAPKQDHKMTVTMTVDPL